MMKKIIILPLIFISSCGYPGSVNGTEEVKTLKQEFINRASLSSNVVEAGFEMLIEQKKDNGEIVSIGSKGIQGVSIDGFDYPVSKIIKNQFRIELPNLIPGKHELTISLYSLNEPIKIPIVIPSDKTGKIFLLLRFNINEELKEISKIEYGFDSDRNGLIDNNNQRFESIGKNNYFIIYTDGKREKIDLSLNTGKTLPSEQVPPGVVPNAQGQNEQSNFNQTFNIPEPPKPQVNAGELYPLPPNTPLDDSSNNSNDKK
ncbi:MAG: hypothetical protein ACK4IX_04620 [Candidatus Sericytochromatia bacterium]